METAPEERLEKILAFWVSGQPKGQPRGRAFVPKKKDGTVGKPHIFTPGTAEAWKGQIAAAAPFDRVSDESIAFPCVIDTQVYFKRPKRLMDKPRTKYPKGPVPHDATPDFDNVLKAICDALVDLGVFQDDKWLSGGVTKWFHSQGGAPGARITIYRRVPAGSA